MFYTYVLQSLRSGRYYVGHTEDLERRLLEHNSNNTASLRNKGPYKIIYHESYPTKPEAIKRELKIKSYKGGKAFKKLIKNTPPMAGRRGSDSRSGLK